MSTSLAPTTAADAPAVEVVYPAQPEQAGAALMPQQAADDHELIRLWLHGRPAPTVKAYSRDVAALLAYTGGTIQGLTLGQLQGFADSISDRATRSQARTLSAIKSLLTFAQRIGYTRYNVGAALLLPKVEDTRGERIVSEGAIHKLLALTPDGRDGLIVRLFYYAGIRCEELHGLCWRNVQQDGQGRAVLAVHGKGSKTRYVLLGAEVATLLEQWRAAAGDTAQPDAPIFRAARGRAAGGPLSTRQLERVVKTAAERAGLPADFSPHWLRHAHASHAHDRGAPLALIQRTLGHASVQTTGTYLHARPDDSSSRYLA